MNELIKHALEIETCQAYWKRVTYSRFERFQLMTCFEYWSKNYNTSVYSYISDAKSTNEAILKEYNKLIGRRHLKLTSKEEDASEAQRAKELHSRHVERPSFISRNWCILLLAGAVGSFISMKVYSIGLAQWKAWLLQGKEVVTSFWHYNISTPLADIFNTIRYEKSTETSLLNSQKSLETELATLEKMLTDYSPSYQASRDSQMDSWSNVLDIYSKEIRHPLRQLVMGDLAQLALIQVQKAKLDGTIIMSSVDKLLKGNQFNFALLTAIPSFAVLYFIVVGVKNCFTKRGNTLMARDEYRQLVKSFREIDALLASVNYTLDNKDVLTWGKLVVRVNAIRKLLLHLPERHGTKELLNQDLDELLAVAESRKDLILQRITRYYGFLNRHYL